MMTKQKTLNNPFSNSPSSKLLEGLQFKDLDGMMKPTVHVDEFSSKMGEDQDIIVVSFFVRDKTAAKDLMSWFERGYDFVLDADISPGEIKPNRYLVYVEMRRRSTAPQQLQQLLNDLNTLTEYESSDWIMHYNGQEIPWSEEAFAKTVPLTPDAYRRDTDEDLNEMRLAAGLTPKKIYETSDLVRSLQSAAGIR
jgi:hypothetical protein